MAKAETPPESPLSNLFEPKQRKRFDGLSYRITRRTIRRPAAWRAESPKTRPAKAFAKASKRFAVSAKAFATSARGFAKLAGAFAYSADSFAKTASPIIKAAGRFAATAALITTSDDGLSELLFLELEAGDLLIFEKAGFLVSPMEVLVVNNRIRDMPAVTERTVVDMVIYEVLAVLE
jgi:hypothetical protein